MLSLMARLAQSLQHKGLSMQRRMLVNINFMFKKVTKNFETFVESIDMNYHEIYYLYQAVSSGMSAQMD